eukprot:gene15496-biopygen1131
MRCLRACFQAKHLRERLYGARLRRYAKQWRRRMVRGHSPPLRPSQQLCRVPAAYGVDPNNIASTVQVEVPVAGMSSAQLRAMAAGLSGLFGC